ncbi:MAG: hydrogenase expression/formation protein HypE [Candidatus Omnitrophica bacterium]|nr:hydrogenase expression/formation protein HypE [Candidatus Omnitrophota bacterium]
MDMSKVQMSYGSGGKATHDFIKKVLVKRFGNAILNDLDDSAVLKIAGRDNLAFTTDSFVVDPIFFKGGDIGKLAVCGTVNDLAVCGALPLYIACSLIIEEGFDERSLIKILDSMATESRRAGVKIVTGDTKVVEAGSADKIFINTSGIGIVTYGKKLSIGSIRKKDKIIINGRIADHGISVLLEREELSFKSSISSDCASLNGVIREVLDVCPNVKFMRDPTRGGLSTTMNEIACNGRFGIRLFEERIPLGASTKAACELLGLDPLYIGNEGKVVMVLPEREADKAVSIMRGNKLGRHAAVIGEVTGDNIGRVVLRTAVGGERIVDMLTKETLPRIC